MSENKSGYELRMTLLGMATTILQDKVGRQVDNEHFKELADRKPVYSYSTEDVIAEAEKLYAFVQKKQFNIPQEGMGLEMPYFFINLGV